MSLACKNIIILLKKSAAFVMTTMCIALTISCRQDMHDQPRFEPLEQTTFFQDGRASRPYVEGTIARGQLKSDAHFYEGKVNGELATTFPFPITEQVLKRGQERYDIFCTPCHGSLGYGNGMIVKRGFRPPPSFHIERLRESVPGHYFDVITNGLGAMYDYAERIKPEDRWAIIAYIRVLQLSQNVPVEELPQKKQNELIGKAE